MNDTTPILLAFDYHWTSDTTAAEIRRWVADAATLAPRRARVLVDPPLLHTLPPAVLERLFRALHTTPELDWFLWSSAARVWAMNSLRRLSADRCLTQTRRGRVFAGPAEDPFDRWLVEWSAGRAWPRHVWLGARITDQAHYWVTLGEIGRPYGGIHGSNHRPRVWIWWPDCAEPAPDLGFAPVYVPHVPHYEPRQKAAKESADRLRELVCWVLAGGRYAEALARHATTYRVPTWITDTEAGAKWTPNDRPQNEATDPDWQ
jgi:hypothetical protein